MSSRNRDRSSGAHIANYVVLSCQYMSLQKLCLHHSNFSLEDYKLPKLMHWLIWCTVFCSTLPQSHTKEPAWGRQIYHCDHCFNTADGPKWQHFRFPPRFTLGITSMSRRPCVPSLRNFAVAQDTSLHHRPQSKATSFEVQDILSATTNAAQGHRNLASTCRLQLQKCFVAVT